MKHILPISLCLLLLAGCSDKQNAAGGQDADSTSVRQIKESAEP